MRVARFEWAAIGFALCAAGCAGNGKGLDQNGQPIGTGGAPPTALTADFQSIQDNVFTPICSKCHIGASAPEGLQLDAAHSYNLLVGTPSAEKPSLFRVKPGDPDDSYMVQKIEGAPGIDGGQMPLGETPLPQATITAIRQWISDGAANASSASVAAANPAFAVEATAPSDHAVVKASLAHVVVTFTQDVDASLVNESTVRLERLASAAAGDAASDARAAVDAGAAPSSGAPPDAVAAAIGLSAANSAVLLIKPATPLSAGTYRVTVRGSGGGAVANLNATILGADTSFVFTVEPTP